MTTTETKIPVLKDVKWDDDTNVEECNICDGKFSFTNRKHHCRLCGKVVCGACSVNKVDDKRSCDACYKSSMTSKENMIGEKVAEADKLKDLSKFDEALIKYRECITLRGSDKNEVHTDAAKIFNSMAICYRGKLDYEKSLDFFQKALNIRKTKLGPDHIRVAYTYNGIAQCHDFKNDFVKSIEFYEKALAILLEKQGANHMDVANTYNNMATVYGHKGDHKKALECLEKDLVISKKNIGEDETGLADSYHNLAVLYDAMKDYDKAMKYFNKAIKINSKSKTIGPNHPEVGYSLDGLGTVYAHRGNFKESLKQYEKALAIMKGAGVRVDDPHFVTLRANQLAAAAKQAQTDANDKGKCSIM